MEPITCLDLDADGKLCIPPGVAATECVAILGKRGSGKSNSVARFLEQLMKHGATASIIDPHNEYAGLRQQFPVYIAGTGFDIPIRPQHGGVLAQWVYDNQASVILAVRDFSTEDRHRFLLAYVKGLQRLHMANRRPHMLVIEEAHNFIPQNGSSPLKSTLKQVATEGRKFGLGVLISDQRSANVDKTVLEMSDIMLLHRATGVNDLKTYKDISDMPGTEQMARKLRIGEAIAILNYDVDAEPVRVQIKRRDTPHGGDTPELVSVVGAISGDSLKDLAVLLSQYTEDEESEQAKEVKALKHQVAEQDQQLADLRAQVKQLEDENALLSKITVINTHPAGKSARNMAVNRLEAQQLVAGSTQLPLIASAPNGAALAQEENTMQKLHNVAAPDTSTAEVYRSPLALTRAKTKQQAAFDILLKKLDRMPRFHRDILKFLIENDGKTFTVPQLAYWLSLSTNTILDKPPLQLIELELVGRGAAKKNFEYFSTARELLQKLCPDHDPDVFLDKLSKACER
jgi:energy-coupling factor transporter ATP-binding protein EcfA2